MPTLQTLKFTDTTEEVETQQEFIQILQELSRQYGVDMSMYSEIYTDETKVSMKDVSYEDGTLIVKRLWTNIGWEQNINDTKLVEALKINHKLFKEYGIEVENEIISNTPHIPTDTTDIL